MDEKKSEEMLYRYISFDSFEGIVVGQMLKFSNPFRDWEDTHEAYLYKMWERHNLEKSKTNEHTDLLMLHSRLNLKALCWTREKNRDRMNMWSIYSYDKKSIMIGVRRKDLEDLSLKHGGSTSEVHVFDVDYKKELDVENEIKGVFPRSNHVFEHLLLRPKRDCFDYEQETRVVMETYGSSSALEKDGYLQISDFNNFIKEVVIHPGANESYVDTVKLFCHEHYIFPVEKSKLLDEPV